MGKKSKPKTPDYQAIAAQSDQYNTANQTTADYANRANQYGPEGSLTWEVGTTTDPITGKQHRSWTQNTNLSPELQALYDSNLQSRQNKADVGIMSTNRLMDEYGSPMDWGGMQDWGSVTDPRYTQAIGDMMGDPNEFRQRGEDASYNSQMRRITPQYERQREQLQSQLRNQGMRPEDSAWQQQMQDLDEGLNDATQMARLSASGEGRQESALNWGQQLQGNQNMFNQNLTANAQNFGMDNTQFNQANALRGQQNNEALQRRAQGLNEANALMSGGQVAMPQFAGYNQSTAAPSSMAMEGALNQGNADAAASQGFWSGLGGLANTGIKAYEAFK